MNTDISLYGVAGLQLKLQELPKRIARNTMRRSIRAAGRYMRDRVRDNAPVGKTGRLRRSIREKESRGRTKLEVATKVFGVRKKSSKGGYYLHLVELGHKTRLGTGKGKPKEGGKAFVPANPFMRRTFETEKWNALRVFKITMQDNLDGALSAQASFNLPDSED